MNEPKNHAFDRVVPGTFLLQMVQAAAKIAADQNSEKVQQKFTRIIAGVQKYMMVSPPPVPRNRTCIWQNGVTRLLYVSATIKKPHAHTIVLIPSLINGWEILDLIPEQSFSNFLSEAGHDVYIVDWGDIARDISIKTFDDLLHVRLAAAIEMVAQKAQQKITLMGYCMGGLLMAGGLPVVKSHLRACAYLATPWDFHAGNPVLTTLVNTWLPSVLPGLMASTTLPNAQIQSLFALVDPEIILEKFDRFLDMDKADGAFARFIAAEDWLGSGYDLPAGIAQTCLEKWYVRNETAGGTWRVGNYAITPDVLRVVPSLVVAPRRDKIVETQTARALYTALGEKKAAYLEPDIGHIGMMVSPRAKDEVWIPVVNWLDTL